MSGKSRRAAQRLALGLALAAAVTLVPARPAAADPVGASARAESLWQAAIDWLASLWSPAPDPDAVMCRGDEGVCIDPNG